MIKKRDNSFIGTDSFAYEISGFSEIRQEPLTREKADAKRPARQADSAAQTNKKDTDHAAPDKTTPAAPTQQQAQSTQTFPERIQPLATIERLYIQNAIHHFGGNILKAAAALEISPSTIYRKMAKWS